MTVIRVKLILNNDLPEYSGFEFRRLVMDHQPAHPLVVVLGTASHLKCLRSHNRKILQFCQHCRKKSFRYPTKKKRLGFSLGLNRAKVKLVNINLVQLLADIRKLKNMVEAQFSVLSY